MTGKEVVTFKGLKALGVPYCRSHIDRMEEAGVFPLSFKLADHRNSPRVWWLGEVFEWLDRRAATRQTP